MINNQSIVRDTRLTIVDEPEKEEEMETFYSGTTLENLRTCLTEDPEGNLLFDKWREERHVCPEAIYCVEDFNHAAGYALLRAHQTNGTSILLEGKLGPGKVMFHKLLRAKKFPVSQVWILKEGSPSYLKGDEIRGAQKYFEARNPLDLI